MHIVQLRNSKPSESRIPPPWHWWHIRTTGALAVYLRQQEVSVMAVQAEQPKFNQKAENEFFYESSMS